MLLELSFLGLLRLTPPFGPGRMLRTRIETRRYQELRNCSTSTTSLLAKLAHT
jgi:hypothetical protein